MVTEADDMTALADPCDNCTPDSTEECKHCPDNRDKEADSEGNVEREAG